MRALGLLQNLVARIKALFRRQAGSNCVAASKWPQDGTGRDFEEDRRSHNDIYPLW